MESSSTCSPLPKTINRTALANNAIESITSSFQVPQKAIQDALRHLLTLIQEQQTSLHELTSESNGLSTRVDVLEQKYRDDKQQQVQQLKQNELKRELQQEFQQKYDAKLDNLAERLASSEKDNRDLRESLKIMDNRHGQELSAMKNSLKLLAHNLGFLPNDEDDEGNTGNKKEDGGDEEDEGHRIAAAITAAKIEEQRKAMVGKVTHGSEEAPVTIQSKSDLRITDRKHGDTNKEAGDDGLVELHGGEERPKETNGQSLAVTAAVSLSEKETIVGEDRTTNSLMEEANEMNEDDTSLNIEDINANGTDNTLPATLLDCPASGQSSTNTGNAAAAASKQMLVHSTQQLNSANCRSSTVILDASKTKLAFHETLVSRLERLEDTCDEMLRNRNNSNDIPLCQAERDKSATSDGPGSFNNNATKEDVLKLEMDMMSVKSRLDSTETFLHGYIDSSISDKSNEISRDTASCTASPPTLSSILQGQNKITEKSIEETNSRIHALTVDLSSRLAQAQLELSQQPQGKSEFSQDHVEMEGTQNHGDSVNAAVISDLQQKMRLLSERLDDQNAKLEAQGDSKDSNLPRTPTAPTDDGWKTHVDKSLLRLETEKADSSHIDSTVATLEDKCNQHYDALADIIRHLREDGLVISPESADDSNLSTGSPSEESEGYDGRLQEALTSIEAAQTTIGSLQSELEGLISKLADKPSLDQIKALLGSVESTYKDRFATHEALQSAIKDIQRGLTQKMTRSDVSSVVSKSIEKARLGLTKEKDSLMIGRAPYRCIGCNSLFPGVSDSIATKVNHNALPTPSIGFGRSLHAKRYYHVREDCKTRRGAGGGVNKARRPRHSEGTICPRR